MTYSESIMELRNSLQVDYMKAGALRDIAVGAEADVYNNIRSHLSTCYSRLTELLDSLELTRAELELHPTKGGNNG